LNVDQTGKAFYHRGHGMMVMIIYSCQEQQQHV
jgi:hypothetical protein